MLIHRALARESTITVMAICVDSKTLMNLNSKTFQVTSDHFTSSSLWFLMPRTKSWRFLSNIRSMLPLTIFKAMSVCDLYRFCAGGPSALQRSSRCLPTRWTVSHQPGYTVRRSRSCLPSPGRWSWGRTGRPVLCRDAGNDSMEEMADKMASKVSWLEYYSHMGISGIKAVVPRYE